MMEDFTLNIQDLSLETFINKIYNPWKVKNVSRGVIYDIFKNPTFEYTNSSIIPNYSKHTELKHFKKYFCLCDETIHQNAFVFIIYALIYLDRFKEKFSNSKYMNEIINVYNLHNLLYISIYLASKYVLDYSYKPNDFIRTFLNSHFSAKLLLEFELKFLETIEYKLYISKEEFNNFISTLE